MTFIDSNVFIRVLCGEDSDQRKTAVQFFEQIRAKKEVGFVEDSVIAEILYVLTSKKLYDLPRPEVTARLSALLSLENIRLDYKAEVLEALKKFGQTNLDFVDCLAIAYQEAGIVEKILSFDKKLA